MPQSHPISDRLISWYKKNKRELPWRDTTDPYRIWLSEIILQQTQVVQGLSYYNKFVENFPTVKHLANATEDKVMRLWQGLGYYSRARNLHTAAKTIHIAHKGVFPRTFTAIKELKGIGDYTAAAIASFAYQLPHAVVDGNVNRVLSRLFDVDTPINSTQGKKAFQLLADELLNVEKPALHNSAMMEFGALWCKPQNPKCENCPVQEHCLAFQNNTVYQRPVKDKKLKIRDRFFHYFIFNDKDSVYIQKRKAKDIWQNLYEFYLIESATSMDPEEILKHKVLKELAVKFKVKAIHAAKKHILSHQHLYATFYECSVEKSVKNETLIKIKRKDLNDYALPQLINKYLLSL
jgi:A/G-specific adenine glycosylase